MSHEQRENIAAFYRALSRMVRDGYEGDWVLIENGSIFGVWSTYEDALDVGYKSFGLQMPFLVKQVKADDPGLQWLAQHEAAEKEYASWRLIPAAP